MELATKNPQLPTVNPNLPDIEDLYREGHILELVLAGLRSTADACEPALGWEDALAPVHELAIELVDDLRRLYVAKYPGVAARGEG